MAIQRGYTTSKELRLHVKLTYAPQNTSAVLDRARGKVPLKSGRRLSGNAARMSEQAALAGREVAQADLAYLARVVARWAQGTYARLGYDIPVRPVSLGAGWKLAVEGGEREQKWARILESGYGPQDTHDFIRLSKKKRAVKIRQKGDTPGFYLIVPKVHGTVSRNKNGKLIYTPKRDDRLGKWINPKVLAQFEARPTGTDVAATFQEADPEVYGVEELRAERYTGNYDPAGRIDWEKDERGRNREVARGVRETVSDNPHWETIRMAQTIRRSGALVSVPAPSARKPNATSERYFKTNKKGDPIPNLANREGARAIAALNSRFEGNRLVRTGVNNLRMVALDASLDLPEEHPAQQQIVQRRGEVLSFLTLSTRKPLRDRPGRPGHYVMQKAARHLDNRIRELIRAAEAEKRQGFYRDGYLEVLKSALGRAL
ncbi:hypothetical protein [Deinococcus sp. S9]|uniref:hypothetical protein n=1 Tax=Deinococcus sp. S9 TaxID=2545754 RepID=UPI0010553724|nr:hypothetical protein [Deinococcus sp. S9]TDE85580.1 hypothetical protein E0686_11250 [Deinococcus sp. S9]